MVERRWILQAMGWAGLGLFLKKSWLAGGALPESDSTFPFEEIPSAASGISWSHTSGRSPDMFLPETVGAG
jgi:hypothetical protein